MYEVGAVVLDRQEGVVVAVGRRSVARHSSRQAETEVVLQVQRQVTRIGQIRTRIQHVVRTVSIQVDCLVPIQVRPRGAIGTLGNQVQVQGRHLERRRQVDQAGIQCACDRDVPHLQGYLTGLGFTLARHCGECHLATDRQGGHVLHVHAHPVSRQCQRVERRAFQVEQAIAIDVHVHDPTDQSELRRAGQLYEVGALVLDRQEGVVVAVGRRAVARHPSREAETEVVLHVQRQITWVRQIRTRIQHVVRAVTIQVDRLVPIQVRNTVLRVVQV